MALTDIEITNQALIKLGANTIESFSENTVEAHIANTLFNSQVDSLLSSHPWGFATVQTNLSESETSPIADYDRSFDLPDDFLRIVSAGEGVRGSGLFYRIIERKLHTNAAEVILTYIYRPSSTDWPAYFDQVLISRLAAEFCIPLTESTSRAETLYRLANEEFNRAKLIEAQQDTPSRIDQFTLIDSRA